MRTIVVGDVHGCGQELLKLLENLRFPRQRDRLIFVGDLFDRGQFPVVVLETILTHQRDGPARGYSMESVCGNHDAELMAACRALYDDSAPSMTLSRSQTATIDMIDRVGMLEDLTVYLSQLCAIDTIKSSDRLWAVVHAGIDPALGLDATPKAVKLTIRASSGAPAWYDEYDGRDGLILCGHQHQTKPLIRQRDGRPVVINVDTGCCYGNCLTAYLIEENRFLSVPAERAYYRKRP